MTGLDSQSLSGTESTQVRLLDPLRVHKWKYLSSICLFRSPADVAKLTIASKNWTSKCVGNYTAFKSFK